MKKTIAILAALAALVMAPTAHAATGDLFDFAPVEAAGTEAPGFVPAQKAWWAGVCDLFDADFAGPGAVGSHPGYSFPNCIDHPPAWRSGNPDDHPIGQLHPPLSPGLTPGNSGPDGWRRQDSGVQGGPAWRLADATQAGARLDASASFWFSRDRDYLPWSSATGAKGAPDGGPRSVRVSVPPGVIGNPSAVPKCATDQLSVSRARCPVQSQVGVSTISLDGRTAVFPVYNVEPRRGKVAELLIANAGLTKVFTTNAPVVASVRSDGDFGIDAFAGEIPAAASLHSQTFTIWAVPWAESHDRYRPVTPYCHQEVPDPFGTNAWGTPGFSVQGLPGGFNGTCDQNPVSYHPSWGPIKPFFTTQTECTAEANTKIEATNYHTPVVAKADSPVPDITGCEDLEFPADISLQPTTIAADSPAGLDVELTIPQNNDPPGPVANNPDDATGAPAYWKTKAGLAVSHLRDTVATLPEGFSINPSAANGQGVCSTEQIGLTSGIGQTPIRFDNDDPHDGKGQECPESAKVAEVVVETPLLDEADWPTGDVYLAAQKDNPFASNYAIYIVLRSIERGLVIKLAGEVVPDPATGKLTTTFADNPQLPFDRFTLKFKGGPTAPLATAPVCGDYQNHTTLSPYSDPDDPVVIDEAVEVSQEPNGAASCPTSKAQRPFNLGFEAGSTEVIGGNHSPFTVRLTRPDGNQEFGNVEVTTPQGFAAKLAGVATCSEASVKAAEARTATGDGAKEQQSPSCPEASKIGTTTIGVGAGSSPFYAKGNVYLAGPYKGAPLSLAFIVPAVAGPFDLGVQVVRAAVKVNPVTAQITTTSDAIPQILEGVPLRIRDIRVDVDRKDFAINPTDCSEKLVTGKVTGSHGASTEVSNRFQVAECARLAFKPQVSLQLFGGVTRAKYQGVRAVVRPRAGDANISGATVRFPSSAFVAQEHLQNICTRVQWAADACPKNSVYGTAEAISPLLDEPLKGNVHLRSSNNLLPDLVADLRGPEHRPIKVEVAIRNDSVKGALRNTVDVAPDTPVTYFRIQVFGGKKALITNSRNICKDKNAARVSFRAHNGRSSVQSVPVRNAKCGKWRKAQKRKVAKRKAAIKRRARAQQRH